MPLVRSSLRRLAREVREIGRRASISVAHRRDGHAQPALAGGDAPGELAGHLTGPVFDVLADALAAARQPEQKAA